MKVKTTIIYNCWLKPQILPVPTNGVVLETFELNKNQEFEIVDSLKHDEESLQINDKEAQISLNTFLSYFEQQKSDANYFCNCLYK
ncbi:7641_t:CDS:2 [Entrophospora sp. SA101]|nr:7641_t:CDS:2 [Entrophospora sp. SA101]